MEKKLLRQQLMKKRDSLTPLEVQDKSCEISRRFLALPQYEKANYILVYLTFNNEVQTRLIIENAWQQQKKVLVPVCRNRDKSLLLSELKSFSELSPGTWNIPEPRKEFLRPAPTAIVELVIIPGVAFDLRGFRLGYGAGYYDRFLPALVPECPLVALAYDFQIIECLPRESHDVPVDIIVTESKTLICQGTHPLKIQGQGTHPLKSGYYLK